MVIFIDLDGTLTNTADTKYKEYKDGISDFDLSIIPIFPDAVNFVNRQKENGHDLVILSDSHPKYVSKIASGIFALDYIFLADKPNTVKTLFYITLQVSDEKMCPICGKQMLLKTNRKKGAKFHTCLPPQFKGDGCGYIENI